MSKNKIKLKNKYLFKMWDKEKKFQIRHLKTFRQNYVTVNNFSPKMLEKVFSFRMQ